MDGIVLINKPKGMTSFQAVSKVRKTYNTKKTGHSGTLDPEAEGLLIIALGKYTKLLPYIAHNHKHYIATFSFGKKYDTADCWGEVIEEKEYQEHSKEELDNTSTQFIGHLKQIPPMYSALKKDGKKLYELARKGIEVERKERDIEVSSLSIQQLSDNSYQMDAIVSEGTYIRTLIEDYCSSLNELGYMTSLKRVGIEHLSIDQAYTLDHLNEDSFISPFEVLDPSLTLLETDKLQDIYNGKKLKLQTNEKRVILVHGKMILACYEERNDGYYHSVRGLF